jgi:hypothetical protein
MSLAVTMTLDDARATMNRVNSQLASSVNAPVLRAALTQWNEYMIVQRDNLFRRGERGPVKWPRLAASTKAARRRSGIGHVRPLDVTGSLRRSIKPRIASGPGGGVISVFESSHQLAGVHDSGATIPRHDIVPKRAKVLRFFVGGKVVFATKVTVPTFKIPSRPLVFITDMDERKAAQLILAEQAKKMGATQR